MFTKLWRSLVLVVVFGLVAMVSGVQPAQGQVDGAYCRISANWSGGTWSSNYISGETAVSEDDNQIPLNTNIAWLIEVQAPSGSCQDTTGVINADMWTTQTTFLSGRRLTGSSPAVTCQDTEAFAVTYRFNTPPLTRDQISSGRTIGNLGPLRDLNLKLSQYNGNLIGSYNTICELTLTIPYDDLVRSEQCNYPEQCATTGNRQGFRLCVGTMQDVGGGEQCLFDQNVEIPNGDKRCTPCTACGQGVCAPGCQGTDQSDPLTYEETCSGDFEAVCGNGLCEAGEGLRGGAGVRVCLEDCNTGTNLYDICNQVGEDYREECTRCIDNEDGIWTAIGCIGARPETIVGHLVTVGLGIGGGIALLMILGGAFIFTTSQGDPKRTSEAKEMIQSAIIGLFFIIFSVTILQFIGVNILQIPGFGV